MTQSAKAKTILIGIFFLLLPSIAGAVSVGRVEKFNIERSYDVYGRSEIRAILHRITNQIYFYVEESWWTSLERGEQLFLDEKMYNLSVEFEREIYPSLTSVFGKEAELGIDREERVTVLIHPMVREAGGYFSSGDVYEKIQYPKSNQRKIVYLNSWYIDQPEAKSFLAHEFVHLITVNQKELLRNVTEEIWLNEARAEYASTLLGYDHPYKGSNLERRVKDFLSNSSGSLTEWMNKKSDYGLVNLFVQYLVDHYGVEILADSLQSNKTGIESLNYALAKNNYDKDFLQIFKDWSIALLVNDCSLGKNYCYLRGGLENFKTVPTLYYLPKTETVLSTFHNTSYWGLSWQKFMGGAGNLVLEFKGDNLVGFEVPYLLCDLKHSCSVGFFSLDESQQGKIAFLGFSQRYDSLTIIPFVKSKTKGFNGQEGTFSFSWTASSKKELTGEGEEALIRDLLVQIEELKRQILGYRAKINAILMARGEKELVSFSCQRLENNLYFGIKNNSQVRCLQEFLAAQEGGIYPEALITGNFLSLTQQAIVRFQEKHASEILAPLGLTRGTGYVGERTREKINQVIGH